MRAALVSSPLDILTQCAPMNLGYLASRLIQSGYEAEIFDLKAPGTVEAEALDRIARWKPDMIGISAMTIEMPGASRIIKELRRLAPGAVIALGGIHPTALPRETLEETGADLVVRSEGETVAVNLAAEISGGKPDFARVNGLSFFSNGEFISTPDEALISDLDSLPFPAWNLMPPKTYSEFPWQLYKRREVVAQILTSRGCPYKCTYCAASLMHRRRLRHRSAENVAEELRLLNRDFGAGEFHIIDDNFSVNKKHALSVCEAIERGGLDMVWKMPNGMGADTITEELVSAMARAGCYQVGIAVETASEELQASIKKGLDLPRIKRSLALLKKHGIETYAVFVFGLPGETPESLRKNIKFMRLNFDHVSISYCVPYPGSELYDDYITARGVNKLDWAAFGHFQPFPGLSNMHEAQLRKYFKIALFSFYSRPSRAFSLLKKIRTLPLSRTLKLVKRYFGAG